MDRSGQSVKTSGIAAGNRGDQLKHASPLAPLGYVPLPVVDIPRAERRPWPPKRRYRFIVFMFLLTCAATFWAGATRENAQALVFGIKAMESALQDGWLQDGLVYMACVMGTLLAHEMGHFLMTVRYRIHATLPLFLPLPITPVGTMGAVIAMNGAAANRRQLFDIGVAGPLAGLIVCIPVVVVGVLTAPVVPAESLRQAPHQIVFHDPLLVEWLTVWLRPELTSAQALTMSPLRLAGWVGLIITGLNMMPLSVLDGGHVTYTMFGKRAHTISAVIIILAILYVVLGPETVSWMVMLILVLVMGIFHPPTADDNVPLGRTRYVIGWLSLAIPPLCFSPRLIEIL